MTALQGPEPQGTTLGAISKQAQSSEVRNLSSHSSRGRKRVANSLRLLAGGYQRQHPLLPSKTGPWVHDESRFGQEPPPPSVIQSGCGRQQGPLPIPRPGTRGWAPCSPALALVVCRAPSGPPSPPAPHPPHHTHLLPPQRRAGQPPTRSLSPPSINGRLKGHSVSTHSNRVWLSNSGTSPLPCAHRRGRPPPRTWDAEALEAAEVGGAQPQHRELGARLVEPRAQVGGQPRRRARAGQNRSGRPGGRGPEAPGGAGGDRQRGDGGRTVVGSGQDGLDGEGGLEASGCTGWAWACRAARQRRGRGRGRAAGARALDPGARGSGRPAASLPGAGHGAALARTGAERGAGGLWAVWAAREASEDTCFK